MVANGRQTNGRFATGNPGGPGRPRRAVEREYLAALSDVVSLDTWREIVGRAVDDAKRGNAKARDWLAKHLLVGPVGSLFDLAVAESGKWTIDSEIATAQRKRERERKND